MAELNTDSGGGHGKGKGKVRSKKASTKVDFTPMVDLGFLLITFFMLTTTLNKPQTMEINMPVKDEKIKEQQAVKESQTVTLILGEKNRIYYYQGLDNPEVKYTNFSKDGIRKVILEKDKEIRAKGLDGIIILIKATDASKYKNLVDILDEMKITNTQRYAIVDVAPAELEMVKNVKEI